MSNTVENQGTYAHGAIMLQDTLSLRDAAALLQIHPETLRKRAVEWGVPHRRLGATWRFSRATVTAWLQEREAA